MKKIAFSVLMSIFSLSTIEAQENENFAMPKPITFWSDVQFGGGLGLGFGSNFTNVSISPSAIKPITDQLHLGLGAQFNYIKSKGFYESTSYGINVIGLYNPAPMIQLSAELEQLRVNNKLYSNFASYTSDNFWNTALFLGAGYSQGNATIGVRYNVLYKDNNFVYNQAWMPFIRVYF